MKQKIETWLIDDDDTFSAVLLQGLETSGDISATGFKNCEEALVHLKAANSPPSVILLDIHLPGMSGLRGIPLFRERSPRTKIIMLTIDDIEDNIVKAIRDGAYGYVLKHGGLDDVITAVHEASIDQRYLDPVSLTKLLNRYTGDTFASKHYHLSHRELEILGLIAAGLSRPGIASRLKLSEGTMVSHYRTIYKKLGVHKISDAVAIALREGLV